MPAVPRPLLVRTPSRVYVFDRVTGQASGRDLSAMNHRVGTCYSWADMHSVSVLDEVLAWEEGLAVATLIDAVTRCERDDAALLVHSPDVVSRCPGLTSSLAVRVNRLVVTAE